LFINILIAASWPQPLQLNLVPRGALIFRFSAIASLLIDCSDKGSTRGVGQSIKPRATRLRSEWAIGIFRSSFGGFLLRRKGPRHDLDSELR
jgi:hypothetical protein